MDRKEQILDIAQRLTQTQGFNGFSYKDISAEIGIKTSSIHYYFKSKDELAVSLIERYQHRLQLELNEIDATTLSPGQKLMSFAGIFRSLAETHHKFCLCGMMAAEYYSISLRAKEKLKNYFKTAVHWMTDNFTSLGSTLPSNDAKAYLALLEGALLLSRLEEQSSLLEQLAFAFISKFEYKN